MCDITDKQLRIIMYFVTLQLRPKNRQRWIDKGFKKITPDNLLKYWSNKIKTDEEIKSFVCDIWLKYVNSSLENPPKIEKEPKPPSLLQKAKSFTESLVEWGLEGMPVATRKMFNERLKICESCEFWDSSAFANTGKCEKCGCSTQAKLRLDTSVCPIGKW